MSKWLPSLNSLRAFEVTARHKSYRKAAEELGVTTAAVQQLVEKLELTIGEKLFTGRGTNLKITPVGDVGFEELSLSFKQIEKTVNRLRSIKDTKSLVISSDPSFASAWLVPKLNNFKKINPNIDVLIDSSTNLVDLDKDAVDLAIRFGVNDYKNNEIVHKLYDEYSCAYCSPALIRNLNKPINVSEIKKFPLLRWDLSQFEWSVNTKKCMDWKNWLQELKFSNFSELTYGPIFNDYNLALQCAIAGQGFILGSKPILKDLLKKKLLIDPFDITVKTNLRYDLVMSEKSLNKPEVKKFIEWIKKEKEISDN